MVHALPYLLRSPLLTSCKGPPECQWAIYSDALEVHRLYWLRFDTVEDRTRFYALFSMGRELANAYHEILHTALDSTIMSLHHRSFDIQDEPLPPYSLLTSESATSEVSNDIP